MEESIFSKIDEEADSMTEASIDGMIPSLLAFYDRKLRFLTAKSYSIMPSNEGFYMAFNALKAHAESKLRSALVTFILDKEHWRNNRKIKPYLDVTLENLSNDLYWEYSNNKRLKSKSFVCPLCRERGFKQVLKASEGMLKCELCYEGANILLGKIGRPSKDLVKFQNEYFVRSTFAIHSKNGFRCDDCLRFIPESSKQGDNIACPYGDCPFFGKVEQLSAMRHPLKTSIKDDLIGGSIDDQYKDFLSSCDVNAEEYLIFSEKMRNSRKLIAQVIKEQMAEVKRNSHESTKKQKLLMYSAFSKAVDKYPADMINYLCNRKQISEPIQSKIFQEYAVLVENALPFSIQKNGEMIDIVSLTDPSLSLFRGISEFSAKIEADFTIPNLTKERYIGGRSYKDYGPCFIGKLIDIKNDDGKSILDEVDSYSFSKIRMKPSSIPGKNVFVKHFRILSHYEIDSLVILQKIRKKMVDSLYFRMHNKKQK